MVNEFDKLKAGKLLLASANMLESNFKRTVLIMCEHNEKGSLGFILNRPMEFKVCEAIAGFEDIEEPLHMGLFWGGDKNQLSFLLNTGLMQPSEIRFFLGYAGWTAGQLESEFEEGAWYTAEASKEMIFSDAYERMWSRSVRSKGGEYQLVANAPELPGLN